MMPVPDEAGYRNIVASSTNRKRANRSKSKTVARHGHSGQVRLIAGRWKGRKLSVPMVEGLRPTGDRVRETLFNWLQGQISGAHCLDLFAGSGALGFEALSRYAQSTTFVEADATAFRGLTMSCEQLEVFAVERVDQITADSAAGTAHLYSGPAQNALAQWQQLAEVPEFNLIFIDPPFQMECQWGILDALVPEFVANGALIYVESPKNREVPESLPEGCAIVRQKQFGEVNAMLLKYTAGH